MQVGGTLYNIGTVNRYLGSGAPGVIALSVVGDLYLDQPGMRSYQCYVGFSPCTSWVLINSGGGGGAPTGPAGGALAGTYPNPTLTSTIAGATCGDATHIPVLTYGNDGRLTVCTPTSFTGTGLTLQTGGVANSNQSLLNIAAGTGIAISNVSGTTTIANTGIPVFQTGGTPNSVQTVLNLVAGTNVGLAAVGGTVTISATGSSGGGNVTASGMTSGAIVTATGPAAIQTPSVTSTLDSSGDMVLAGYMKSIDQYQTVLQYAGCDPTGSADSTTCFNTALAANAGSTLVIPKGTYKVGQINIPAGTTLLGWGIGSRLNRNGAIGAGSGWIDLNNVSNIRLSNFMIDGQVTSPVGVDYTTVVDPLQANFTLNSSIWVHGGSNITFDHLLGQHTGGYLILLDATTNNISGVTIDHNVWQDNRPFLFGVGGDLTYGSWPGGILYRSNGSTRNIQSLAVTNNQFLRMAGNTFWGNAQALTLLNKGISVSGNYFQDIGLDAIQIGPVDGYTVSNNVFLRIGYVSTSDGTIGTPKWFNAIVSGIPTSIPSEAIDSTALALNFTVTGNTVVAHNGGCLELDGSGFGSVLGNHCYIPAPGDPEYTDAQPSNWGPAVGPGIGSPGMNYMYGLQTGNSSNQSQSASHITISGNSFYGQGGGALRLYAARNVLAENNDIWAPATIFFDPVVIGTRGTTTNLRAQNVEVANNKIQYAGSSGVPAVFEDSQFGAFQSGDINKVHDNTLSGNLSEFSKDANSSSINYGSSLFTAGACSGTSACTTLSRTLTSNSQYGSSAVNSIATQVETASGNVLYRWYSSSGDLLLTTSTDGSLRVGDGTIGSLWLGGNLTVDAARNLYSNSLLVGGSFAVDSSRNGFLNSLTLLTGGLAIDSSRNANLNSYSINSSLVIDSARNMFASSLFNGGNQTIDNIRNARLNSVSNASGGLEIDSAGNFFGNSLSIGGSLLINSSRQVLGVLNVPAGILSGSGISAPGFNPTGFSGSTITLQVGCTVSSGFCTSVYFTVGGTNYANVDITGGVVRGVH